MGNSIDIIKRFACACLTHLILLFLVLLCIAVGSIGGFYLGKMTTHFTGGNSSLGNNIILITDIVLVTLFISLLVIHSYKDLKDFWSKS